MYRVIFVTIVTAVTLSAQGTASIPNLRQTAEEKTRGWDTLAKALENKIRGLLPCDPKIATAVAEVNRASDARLVAFNEYFRAVLAETSSRAAEASRLLDSQTKTGLQFLETEHAEGVEERAGIEYQISQLIANPERKSEIGDAETALRAVAGLTDRRNLIMVQQSVRGDALNQSLRTLVSQSLAAEAAVKALAAAHATEAERWRAYYVARLARVDAECTAISPTPITSRPRAGAQ
jgi:uncharacterized protein YciW